MYLDLLYSRPNFIKLTLGVSIICSLVMAQLLLYQPLPMAQASSPSSSLPNIFPSTIYRVSEHVHSIDESTTSNHYYSTFVKGYDKLYFAYQSIFLLGTDLKDPGFESGIIPSSSWSTEQSGSSFSAGYPIIEAKPIAADGLYSLHVKSVSTGTSFAYAGVLQDNIHNVGSLASNFNVSYKIMPVSLTDTTSNADSEIQVRFRLLYWDSKTVFPNIVFVYQDDRTEPIGFSNDTNTVYLVRTAVPNQWNTYTEDLTNIAKSYWGISFANDQAVDMIMFRVYTRNGGTAEAYFDSTGKAASLPNNSVYATQVDQQLPNWSTPSFALLPGEELNGDNNIFGLNIPSNKFVNSGSGPNGPYVDVDSLHNVGVYAGLAHPFQSDAQLQKALGSNYNVDMVDIYGSQGTAFVTNTTVWDSYLNSDIYAMATATPNVHSTAGVDRMNTNAFAIDTFSNSNTASQIAENIAMGKSFVETVAVGGGSLNTTPMALYFAAQNDQVPMGRYPIVVDANTQSVTLHVIVKNVPSSYSSVKLVMKQNGNAVGSTISIPGGTSQYDNTFTLNLSPVSGSDRSTYFRYEIQDTSGAPLGFSQPLIFVKASAPIYSGYWTALVPQSSAALNLPPTSVSLSTSNVISEQVTVRLPQIGDGQIATVKSFIPVGMFSGDVFTVSANGDPSSTSSLNWSFDSVSRILTVNAAASASTPLTIFVQPLVSTNQPPVANAGADFAVDEDARNIGLDGSASYDPDGTISSYLWQQTAGPSVTLTNAQSARATVDAAPCVSADTPLQFKLSVTDNAGTTTDDSVTVTTKDIPTSQPYHYCPSFFLTGSQYNDTPSSSSLQLTQFTVAAWFKTTTDYAADTFIANKGGTGLETIGKNMNYGIWMDNLEKIEAGFETTAGSDKFVVSPNSYSNGQWHYAVVTYDGTATLRLYIDGVQVASKLTSGALPDNTGTQPFRVGANSFKLEKYFNGNIDEVRVWNRELSSTEVNAQYNAATFDVAGQILHLRFGADNAPVANAQSVTTSEDTAKSITLTASDVDGDPLTYSVVSSPVHGTLSGTAPNLTYTPAANYSGPDSFAFKVNDGTLDSNTATVSISVVVPPYHYGGSFVATGSNKYDVSSSSSLQLTQFSVASWFKTTTNYGSDAFIANKGGTDLETAGKNMNYGIWMTSSEKIRAGFETSTGTDNFATSSATYNDGNWHYTVVTYDGSNVILYIDGVQVAIKATSSSSTPDNTGTQPFRVGANSLSLNKFFTGNVDEVRVWNRAITSSEVSSQYDSGTFNTSGQMVYLPF